MDGSPELQAVSGYSRPNLRLSNDMSDELTHFIGKALDGDEARYDLLRKILQEGLLTHLSHDPRIVVSIYRNAKISENEM